MAKPLSRLRIIAGAVFLLALIAVADWAFPPPIDRAAAVSTVVVDRNDQWVHAFANREGRWRFQTIPEDVDPSFLERLVRIEDRRFYRHPGVDPIAVTRAAGTALRHGRVVSGASTITMQTARLLEPRPRNLRSKALEMIRALQIERRLSKREILSLYLTLAPYGGNLEGVRAASLFYFDKEPLRLTNAEQALLIALPQAPEARRPDRNPDAARNARAEILAALVRSGALEARLAEEAALARLPTQRHARPKLAYHAARHLAISSERAPLVRSTLDSALQARAEALIARSVAEIDDGATASLLIVETKTGKIRAAVGSSGLDAQGGWIDMTRAIRSPGSTLKPFIYAFAFEDGRLSPATIIDDMPRAFGDYTPENFDRRFRGEVHADEALQHSLNLPAVAALNQLGAGRFFSKLAGGGVDLQLREAAPAPPGLAIALGGAGVAARDLAGLYAGLGNGGRVPWLILREDEAPSQPKRIVSQDTADSILTILANAPSLEGRAPSYLSEQAIRVAFKTGTSYGYRDAWAAGVGAGYTIVAWVGRADGGARAGQTGRATAAPILFEAFDLVDELFNPEPLNRPGPKRADDSATALGRLDAPSSTAPPEIVFPQHGVELFINDRHRGFSLTARGGAGGRQWYINGEPLSGSDGRAFWRPPSAGFYQLTVVDGEGREARAKVRVRSTAVPA